MRLEMRLALHQECPDCDANVGEHGATHRWAVHTPECPTGKRNATRRARRFARKRDLEVLGQQGGAMYARDRAGSIWFRPLPAGAWAPVVR